MKKYILLSSLVLSSLALCSCQENITTNSTSSYETTTNETTTSSIEEKELFYKNHDIVFFPNYHSKTDDSKVSIQYSSGFVILDRDAKQYRDYIPESYTLERSHEYVIGDIYRFEVGYVREGVITNPFSFNGSIYDNGVSAYETIKSCTYIPTQIIKVDESLIDRDEEGYITKIYPGNHWISMEIDYSKIIIERTRNTGYNRWVDLNEYNGEVYASIQEDTIYAYYSYDFTQYRDNETKQL